MITTSINNIDKYKVAVHLGYRDKLPDIEMTKMILECEDNVLKLIKPQYSYKMYDVTKKDNELFLENSVLHLNDEKIISKLSACTKISIVCATLAGDIDALASSDENMVINMIYDALTKVALDQLCEMIENDILKSQPELEFDNRLDVRAGDLPLEYNKLLLDELEENEIIQIKENGMLQPSKSVIYIIGYK